jgi:hypothetical protein
MYAIWRGLYRWEYLAHCFELQQMFVYTSEARCTKKKGSINFCRYEVAAE